MKNVRSLRKLVNEGESGEMFYMNAIGCSIAMIEQLREYIQSGKVEPLKGEVEKVYNNVEAVMSGDVIFPQMTYVIK